MQTTLVEWSVPERLHFALPGVLARRTPTWRYSARSIPNSAVCISARAKCSVNYKKILPSSATSLVVQRLSSATQRLVEELTGDGAVTRPHLNMAVLELEKNVHALSSAVKVVIAYHEGLAAVVERNQTRNKARRVREKKIKATAWAAAHPPPLTDTPN